MYRLSCESFKQRNLAHNGRRSDVEVMVKLFGWRIVWALKLSGIQFDFIDEDLSNKSPLLIRCNPVYNKISAEGKEIFGGEKIGLIDLVLGWLANTVCVLEVVDGFKIIERERSPLLSAWMREFAEVPLIIKNRPPYETLLAKFHAVRQASLVAAPPK
ncbi:hypothetical protein CICLE_v10033926mg [Citrus x clementina]|uniref:Glutathione S-transferase n=1 Tax=Citrus clementina TaxID=85681 RepID=V4TLA0_CITCL|nr:hypothetical protein CICLE_v10033926mg [Citrus x clementina]